MVFIVRAHLLTISLSLAIAAGFSAYASSDQTFLPAEVLTSDDSEPLPDGNGEDKAAGDTDEIIQKLQDAVRSGDDQPNDNAQKNQVENIQSVDQNQAPVPKESPAAIPGQLQSDVQNNVIDDEQSSRVREEKFTTGNEQSMHNQLPRRRQQDRSAQGQVVQAAPMQQQPPQSRVITIPERQSANAGVQQVVQAQQTQSLPQTSVQPGFISEKSGQIYSVDSLKYIQEGWYYYTPNVDNIKAKVELARKNKASLPEDPEAIIQQAGQESVQTSPTVQGTATEQQNRIVVDAAGNPVNLVDASGNPVVLEPTVSVDGSGNHVVLTDEKGNFITVVDENGSRIASVNKDWPIVPEPTPTNVASLPDQPAAQQQTEQQTTQPVVQPTVHAATEQPALGQQQLDQTLQQIAYNVQKIVSLLESGR